MRSPSRGARYVLFSAPALLAAFAVAGGAWADAAAGLSGAAESAVKLLLILALAAALSFFGPAQAPLFSRFPARYGLLALLPPAADGTAIVGMVVLAAAALALLIRGGLLVRGKEAVR